MNTHPPAEIAIWLAMGGYFLWLAINRRDSYSAYAEIILAVSLLFIFVLEVTT